MAILPSKPRQRACLFALLALPPLLFGVCLWLSQAESQPSDGFSRIRPGMTPDEARGVLEPSLVMRCISLRGARIQMYLVIHKFPSNMVHGPEEGGTGLVYFRDGTVRLTERTEAEETFRSRFRKWWWSNSPF